MTGHMIVNSVPVWARSKPFSKRNNNNNSNNNNKKDVWSHLRVHVTVVDVPVTQAFNPTAREAKTSLLYIENSRAARAT